MAYDSGRQQTINTDSQAAKNLGYSGSTNAEFDEWYKGLDPLQLEYMQTENPVLLQYIQALNSAKDPYIRQQLEGAYANFKSQSFNPNLLQWFGELFGDTSARANFNNQLNSGFSESIKNIIEGMHTEEYTDPAAETARRRAAGLNVDLSGGSQIGSGDPAKIDESQLAPGVVNDGSSGADVISQIAQYGISFVTQTMEFAKGIQSLRQGSLMNVAQDLSNHSTAMDLIAEEVMNSLSISDISDANAINDSVFLDHLGALVKDNSFNHSTKRVLQRYYNTIKNQSGTGRLQTAKMELAQRYMNARKGTASIMADPLFSSDFTDYIGTIGKRWSSLVFELDQLKLQYDKESLTGKGLENGLDNIPSTIGKHEYNHNVNSLDADSYAAAQRKAVEGFFAQIYKDLENGDKWYHKVGLVLLPLFRGLVTHLLSPSVGISSQLRF